MQLAPLRNSKLQVPDLPPTDNTARERLREQHGIEDIIGQSERMLEVFELIEKVADSDSTILVNGETGTGKGLVARAIHQSSYRKNKPFVSINCGAIPENLLESELFGHVRGAFTGAISSKPGKFELANGGTVFLDEIGDMSPELQVKVLRVLEEKEFDRIGGSKTIKVDVRIITATHRDLETEVEKGSFREDLFYRLNVIPITIPALREREPDIPILISCFLEQFNQEKKKQVEGISDDALESMLKYPWPGNVRELKNMMERLVVLKGEGEILVRDLPEKLRKTNGQESMPKVEIPFDGLCLNTEVSQFEKALIFQSLEETKWVKNKAAKLLRINRTTLVEKIKRHRLEQLAC